MSTWIAEEPVIFVHPDGTRTAGRIAVGLPEFVDDDHAGCAIALDGLHRFGGPMFGATPLQALMLGLQTVGYTIHGFLERGGRILDPDDDSDFHPEAYFGPLLRAPDPNARPPD